MSTELNKMLSGEMYDASDPELVSLRKRSRTILREFNQIDPDEKESGELIRSLFGSAGEKIAVIPPLFCDYGRNIHAGHRIFMNSGCVILDCAEVHIGDDVLFGPSVQIYTATHPLEANLRATGVESAKTIRIGNKVWIGGGAIICPGVTIGANTTIGAGSVVTKDIPANVFAAGNPCRVIKDL